MHVAPQTVSAPAIEPAPLCVDLDGTLINTDLMFEYLVLLAKRDPAALLRAPFWLLQGRARLKAELAARVEVDASTLPYHHEFLDYLKREKQSGRKLYLVTASDYKMAERVGRHLGLFDEVMASDGQTNLRGQNKGARLSERFGERAFDYAGNSTVDLPVWKQARAAIVVNAGLGLERKARKVADVKRVFLPERPRFRALFRALRPHQWVKNLIVFVPVLTSHSLTQFQVALWAVLAFVSFSLSASAMYVLNDLLDLETDRHHRSKRMRPLACGDLSIPAGALIVPILLLAGLGLAEYVGHAFAGVLAIYLGLTAGYSWGLKKVPILDVFCLAGLYTIRLVAGHEAARINYSFWLLVFSMFIFLSLALVKRFQEIDVAQQKGRDEIRGRGYAPSDRELVASLGAISGYMSALVLALYVNSHEVQVLYHHPMLLLLVCPLLLYWISRVWFIAHRGLMHEDPIVFALRDKVSYAIGGLTLLVLWLATGR